ncbi:MAG TPA: hypothetical protein VJ182_07250 [Anaerolineales bacterium]|nr:hypothetical protein [Anaerolineales bacterium]
MNLKLSAPREITWIIAVIAGGLGILVKYGDFDFISVEPFLLVTAGFIILAVATIVKSL